MKTAYNIKLILPDNVRLDDFLEIVNTAFKSSRNEKYSKHLYDTDKDRVKTKSLYLSSGKLTSIAEKEDLTLEYDGRFIIDEEFEV